MTFHSSTTDFPFTQVGQRMDIGPTDHLTTEYLITFILPDHLYQFEMISSFSEIRLTTASVAFGNTFLKSISSLSLKIF
jgi:hypothetical protein